MAQILPRSKPYICRTCLSAQVSRPLTRTFATTAKRSRSLREQLEERGRGTKPLKESQPSHRIEQHDSRSATSPLPAVPRSQTIPTVKSAKSDVIEQASPSPSTIVDPTQELKFVQEGALALLELNVVPEESETQMVLSRAQRLAATLKQRDLDETQRISRLSEVEGQHVSQICSASNKVSSQTKIDLAKAIYTVLEDPKIYITPDLLKTYVHTVTTLELPQYLPKIFHLYAHKPIPKVGSQIISSPEQQLPENQHLSRIGSMNLKFTQPWSRHPKYAIPPELAELAIESAIAARDMPLAISLIDTTVATPQYHIAKFIRRAAIPLGTAGLILPATYNLSKRAAEWQVSWDTDTFFWMCISGGGAYIATMGTLLLITVTTWNDHHKRVRWVPGTPMGRRWFREEERYYFDRIAEEWGFKDVNKHGEERGEEWEALREVCGLRWMEVDRTSLLPGML